MKKVLFTSHTANFQKFNHPFMKWFKSQGYEVHYASMGEEKVIHCDKHFTVSFNRSPYSLDNVHAYKPLKKIIDTEQYDIIHCHTPMGSVVTRLAARSARKKLGTRVFYTAHGFHFYTGAPILNWIIYYPVEKLLAHITDVLVTINEEDYVRAQKKLRAKSIIKINGVGVDLKRFRPVKDQKEKDQLRQEYGFDKDDYILICVAELNGNKNQEFLIQAMQEITKTKPKVKLLLCGVGGYEKRYRKLITELGLKNSVLLMGYRKDINKLMRMSDIGVSASIREGMPLNVIEEIASGIPVLVSNNRGHKEIIQNRIFGSVFQTSQLDIFIKQFWDYTSGKSIETLNKRRKIISKYSLTEILEVMSKWYTNQNDQANESYTYRVNQVIREYALYSELPMAKSKSRISRRGLDSNKALDYERNKNEK
jgi:glycosyltransferase EpsD